ncbi:hypothetical protein TrCOL_g13172 [Triparma columacea]|uniref:Uncharacterized protein n=1 Tax=Triparma columacea TaxID=722753 RepID=A0A9W7G012_9STRA|nr:hypothetical protein TrCOL_g13172 [Triparma columacea]
MCVGEGKEGGVLGIVKGRRKDLFTTKEIGVEYELEIFAYVKTEVESEGRKRGVLKMKRMGKFKFVGTPRLLLIGGIGAVASWLHALQTVEEVEVGVVASFFNFPVTGGCTCTLVYAPPTSSSTSKSPYLKTKEITVLPQSGATVTHVFKGHGREERNGGVVNTWVLSSKDGVRVMRTQTDYRGGEEEEERMFPIHGYVGPTFEESYLVGLGDGYHYQDGGRIVTLVSDVVQTPIGCLWVVKKREKEGRSWMFVVRDELRMLGEGKRAVMVSDDNKSIEEAIEMGGVARRWMEQGKAEVDWGMEDQIRGIWTGKIEDWREYVGWVRAGMSGAQFARFFLRCARGMEDDERRSCFPLPPPLPPPTSTSQSTAATGGKKRRESITDLVDVCLREGDARGAASGLGVMRDRAKAKVKGMRILEHVAEGVGEGGKEGRLMGEVWSFFKRVVEAEEMGLARRESKEVGNGGEVGFFGRMLGKDDTLPTAPTGNIATRAPPQIPLPDIPNLPVSAVTKYKVSIISLLDATAHPSELIFYLVERNRAEGEDIKGRRILKEWSKYAEEEGMKDPWLDKLLEESGL